MKLRTLRQARGLTQQQLADRVKVAQSYINALENGTRKNPSLAVLKRIAKALGATVAELLGFQR